MNNLEVILESIISEGKTESQNILDDANAKAYEIVNAKKSEADKKAAEILASAQKEAETIIKNEEVSANRESRDIEIAAKNKVIDEIVDALLENLKNLDSNSYKTFIDSTLKKSGISNGELILSDGHKDALKNADFGGLKVSDETVEDGFVVKSGKIEYDNRFSSIIKYNIDDIRKQISDEIFN
ncbi:V-type ATP synthase subunit E [Anaerococcus sp. ENR1011]|uniref:V-type ATP synthase subunit E n=1 Tax=Anaerococcus groningensis TaxID=3115616 RepID=A0ABW9MZM8_9FIRM